MKPEANSTAKKSLKVLVVLNLYDAICTYIWVTSGVALEANPLMASLLDISAFSFMLTKVLLVNLGIWLIWQNIDHLFAKIATVLVVTLYGLVSIKHTFYAVQYLFNMLS